MSVRWSRTAVHLTRDSALFVIGMLGIAHETLVAATERPTLLILFGAMVGLPAFLRTDEKPKPLLDPGLAEETPPQPKVADES